MRPVFCVLEEHTGNVSEAPGSRVQNQAQAVPHKQAKWVAALVVTQRAFVAAVPVVLLLREDSGVARSLGPMDSSFRISHDRDKQLGMPPAPISLIADNVVQDSLLWAREESRCHFPRRQQEIVWRDNKAVLEETPNIAM